MKLHPILALGFVASASVAFAATVPYSDAFQSNSTTGWINTGTATWSIVNTGTSNVYQASGTASAGSFSSVQQLTNIGTGVGDVQNFTITTHFKLSDLSNGAFVGIAAFGSTSGLGTNYLADINATGSMRIISQGTNSDFVAPSAVVLGGGNFTTAKSYTMTFAGTYVGSALNLTFTVSDGTNTKSIIASDATPYSGEFFGLRVNNSLASDPLAVRFSDFSVTTSAIPEPATFASLAGLGALGLAALRRRRA